MCSVLCGMMTLCAELCMLAEPVVHSPRRVSQLLQETLPELVAAQVTKCFKDNVAQFPVDSERSRQQRKVPARAHRTTNCVGSDVRGSKVELSVAPLSFSEQGGQPVSGRELRCCLQRGTSPL